MQLIASIFITLLVSAGVFLHTGNEIADVQKKAEALGANQKISELTAMTSLDDADYLVAVDNSTTPTTKRITVANATSSLKTLYDTLYSPIFSTSAGLRGLLSDETGSGFAVFATSPTLTSATMTTPYINVSGTEARGDLFYSADGGGELSRLAIGSTGNLLGVSSGIPAWTDVSSSVLTFGFTRMNGLLSTASSTIYGLTIGDSLPATTTDNILIENNASTTNATISRVLTMTTGSEFRGFASSTAYEIVTNGGTNNGPTTIGGVVTLTVTCSTGKVATGGGGTTSAGETDPVIRQSYPSAQDKWTVEWRGMNNSTANDITAYAVCVKQ